MRRRAAPRGRCTSGRAGAGPPPVLHWPAGRPDNSRPHPLCPPPAAAPPTCVGGAPTCAAAAVGAPRDACAPGVGVAAGGVGGEGKRPPDQIPQGGVRGTKGGGERRGGGGCRCISSPSASLCPPPHVQPLRTRPSGGRQPPPARWAGVVSRPADAPPPARTVVAAGRGLLAASPPPPSDLPQVGAILRPCIVGLRLLPTWDPIPHPHRQPPSPLAAAVPHASSPRCRAWTTTAAAALWRRPWTLPRSQTAAWRTAKAAGAAAVIAVATVAATAASRLPSLRCIRHRHPFPPPPQRRRPTLCGRHRRGHSHRRQWRRPTGRSGGGM